MPREIAIHSYATVLFGPGHQAPPEEVWAGEMKVNPIPVLRLTTHINEYEKTHKKPCPPGQVIALAKVQGLDVPEAMAEKLLEERKAWRGHKVIPDPGQGYELTVSVTPKEAGGVEPAGGEYFPGKTIQIFATPNKGYQFDRWTGAYLGKDNPCKVTMNSDKKITAHFKKKAVEPVPGGTP